MKETYQKDSKKIFCVLLAAWLLFTGVTCFFFVHFSNNTKERIATCYLELSSMQNAVNEKKDRELLERFEKIEELLLQEKDIAQKHEQMWLLIIWITVSVFIWAGYLFLYIRILSPFYKLEKFAGAVARGEMDIPLLYERKNYFGAFTWAFDNMRTEIKRARSAEQAAIENNKTVIATISHDIRTPIASICAYCEALQAGLAETEEEKAEYFDVIIQKCDEVSTLTSDLLLHSLSDLKKLQMNFELCDSRSLVEEIQISVSFSQPEIEWDERIPSVQLNVDKKRLEQVYENLIGNAKKYAPGKKIRVFQYEKDGWFVFQVKDEGDGVEEEEIPFLFNRFYRGKNTTDKPGAGLGLYITKYIVEQMGGRVCAKNVSDGFLIKIQIPVVLLKTS